MKLQIDSEFQTFLRPQNDRERSALRAALVKAGRAREPIAVWGDTIIDGHNRYELCTELGLPFDVTSVALPDRAAALRWIFENQCAKRNLTEDQQTILAVKSGIEIDAPPAKLARARALVAANRADLVTDKGLSIAVAWGLLQPRKPRAPRPPAPSPEPLDPVAQRLESKNVSRIKAEHKSLADELANLREILRLRDQLAQAPLPPIPRREFASGLREATACALLSDFHVEERVRSTDTPTGNVYTLEIADLRLGRFFSGVEWLVNKEREAFKIRDLKLWFGGDLMSGHIHDENVETSALSPIATLVWLQPRLVAGVRQLLDRLGLEQIQLICSYGNHGRDTLKSRRATGAHHSYEWGMYQQLAQIFASEPRVKVLADPSGHQYSRAYDFDCHWHHGDETSYQGGVGGILIPLNKAVAAWDRVRRCHFHNFGHWHQYTDAGHITVNGSGIGFNAYAMSIKASPEVPQQAFYLIDSKRGKTAKSPIWVSDAAEEAKLIEAAQGAA